MWSPGLTVVTPAPTSSTMPAASWPRTMGSGTCQSPFMMCQSLWQTPAALTRTARLARLRSLLLEVHDLERRVRFVQDGSLHRNGLL